MIFEPDQFLWDVFGYPAYKVVVSEPWSDLNVGVNSPAFLWAKIPTDKVSLLHQLCVEGFKVIDVSITLQREPTGNLLYYFTSGVKDATPDDFPAILKIASEFEYSRFHLDPQIPRDVADRVKEAWVENYFAGSRGEKLLVAKDGDQATPTGFLAVMQGEGSCKIIDLIAVSRDCRRQGVGRRLVAYFLNSYPWNTIEVGTQIANTPSLRLYESCGFKIVKSEYVLHAHCSFPVTSQKDAFIDLDF